MILKDILISNKLVILVELTIEIRENALFLKEQEKVKD